MMKNDREKVSVECVDLVIVWQTMPMIEEYFIQMTTTMAMCAVNTTDNNHNKNDYRNFKHCNVNGRRKKKRTKKQTWKIMP